MLLASTIAWTQPSWAEADTQIAEDGGVFRMPAGDLRTAADYRDGDHVIPLRSPTPDAELARLKASRAAAGPNASVSEAAKSRALFTECVTNAATGFAPSDIHGAAGPTNIVVVTNVDISVRNKSTCALVSAVSLKTFFNNFSIPATQTLFDPRVLFDRLHSRCLVTVESSDSSNTDQFLYVAASTNSSCTSWRRIRFILSRVSPSAKFCKALQSDFYDFPNTGYMGTRMVVTSNNFPAAGGGNGTIMSIDLTALLGTASVNASCFRSGLPTNIAPAIVSSSAVTQMFLLSPGSGSGSSVSRRRLNVSASGPSSDSLSTVSSISIPAWTAPPDAAQPNGQRLDSSDGRFASATKQIGSSLWNVHTINSGGFARFRLYKFSTSGTSPLFTFTPTTSSCSNADHLFSASVDTNSTASGTLAFVTASRTCPSQATAGRAAHLIFRGNNSSSAGWVFNTVETSATNFATESGFACNTASPPTKPRASCRWGDYSATQIDPSNTGRAWGFNQLVTGTTSFNWNTRAGLVGP
jgi:hypothetical protein